VEGEDGRKNGTTLSTSVGPHIHGDTSPAYVATIDSATREEMDELMAKPITPLTFDPALKQALVTLRKDLFPRYVLARKNYPCVQNGAFR
jgi:hypothetical protein